MRFANGSAVALVQALDDPDSQEVSLSLPLFRSPLSLHRRLYSSIALLPEMLDPLTCETRYTRASTQMYIHSRRHQDFDVFTRARMYRCIHANEDSLGISIPDDLRTKIKRENKILKDFLNHAHQRFLDFCRELLSFKVSRFMYLTKR